MARPSDPWFRSDRNAWVCTIDGKQHTLAKGRGARAEARRAFHQLMARAGREEADDDIPLGELADRFLAQCVADELGKLTVEFYQRHIGQLLDAMGHAIPARTLRPYHITDWLNARVVKRRDRKTGEIVTKPLSKSSRHGAITSVKRLYRWARRMGHLRENPMDPLEKPGIDRREHIMTPEQEAIALAAAGAALADYLNFLRETWCRPSEAQRLRVEHCRMEQGVVVLPPRESKTGRRTGRSRVIYLNDAAKAILARRLATITSGEVFLNTRGRPWTRNSIAQAMDAIREKTGLGPECVAESLRHAAITDAKLQLPNSAVSHLAGHTSTAMVDHFYGHLDDRQPELADAMNRVRRTGTGSPAAPPSGSPSGPSPPSAAPAPPDSDSGSGRSPGEPP